MSLDDKLDNLLESTTRTETKLGAVEKKLDDHTADERLSISRVEKKLDDHTEQDNRNFESLNESVRDVSDCVSQIQTTARLTDRFMEQSSKRIGRRWMMGATLAAITSAIAALVATVRGS